MRIGFDAKRAFHNVTGLGNYSRNLITSLANLYPDNQYFLYNPVFNKKPIFKQANLLEVNPKLWYDKLFPSFWRQKNMVKDIQDKLDIYHGLSNELPYGLEQTNVKSVVTIHDLIFEHYPEHYKKSDVFIYRKKFKHACTIANKIIAISQSTKADLSNLYSIDPLKIEVCYQSCDERFYKCLDTTYLEKVKAKYKIDTPYFISVGSLIERKNLLTVCKALNGLRKGLDVKLLVVGKGKGKYYQAILDFIKTTGLSPYILFVEDHFSSVEVNQDLPALLKLSKGLIYPSLMEGFGIPVLEAMAVGTAVITSNLSSLKEVGDNAACLIHPLNVDEMMEAMKKLIMDDAMREEHIKLGYKQAAIFSNEQATKDVMKIYETMYNDKY